MLAKNYPPPTASSEKLITQNLGLARMMANRWAMHTQQPYDDLIGVAMEGLIIGCRKYDPERINPATGEPYKISTIVVTTINSEMMHYFRDHCFVVTFSQKWREKWGMVRRMHDAGASMEEIAAKAGLKAGAAEVREMLAAMKGCTNIDTAIDIEARPDGFWIQESSPLLQLVRDAWASIRPSDCNLILAWWDARRPSTSPPSGPMQQLSWRISALRRGQTLRRYQELTQLALPAEDLIPEGFGLLPSEVPQLPELQKAPRPARSRRRGQDVVQLVMI
jgi:hypothetical protein